MDFRVGFKCGGPRMRSSHASAWTSATSSLSALPLTLVEHELHANIIMSLFLSGHAKLLIITFPDAGDSPASIALASHLRIVHSEGSSR